MAAFYQFSGASEFWELAPVEANALIAARSRQRIIAAYEQAKLHRLAKSKHFPKTTDELLGEVARPTEMSFDAMFRAAKSIHAATERKSNGR